jgi:hypothetical protein
MWPPPEWVASWGGFLGTIVSLVLGYVALNKAARHANRAITQLRQQAEVVDAARVTALASEVISHLKVGQLPLARLRGDDLKHALARLEATSLGDEDKKVVAQSMRSMDQVLVALDNEPVSQTYVLVRVRKVRDTTGALEVRRTWEGGNNADSG